MATKWTADAILELARGYQESCVLAAAADLDLFTQLAAAESTAAALAEKLQTDPRATTYLLDALAALGLLEKHADRYRVAEDAAALLTNAAPRSVLPMVQHQANCLRRWTRLPWVVRTGRPADSGPSLRGEEADRAAFLEAMNCVSLPLVADIVNALQPLQFRHLLDIGGATGTWTIAFLRAVPTASATIFDLPDAIPLAKRRLLAEGLASRVHLVGGDFYTDPLPRGADLAWLGAIIHQNSPAQNRELYRKIYDALAPGGQVLIRDIIMDSAHTRPFSGALFAINMLTATDAGGTYSFEEVRNDLLSAGFTDPQLVRQGKAMDSLVRAAKPAQLPPV